MSSRKVDVAIIGAGTAGITAFSMLKNAGKNVVLIDRGPLGTTCARVGCMPSKAALHAGMRWKIAKQLPGNATLPGDVPQMLWNQVRHTRDMLTDGMANRIRTVAGEQLIMGEASFEAPGILRIGTEHVETDAVIVATGSVPIIPQAFDDVSSKVLTTDTLFELETLPDRLGIIGLGAIGLELGLALSRLDVRVVAADLRNTIGGINDPVILDRAMSAFKGELPMWLDAAIETRLTENEVLMRTGDHTARVDHLLVATGRAPNTASLNLAAAGIPLDSSGQPSINPLSMQTIDAPIFFAGDVQPDRPLMHESVDEGKMAAQATLSWLRGEPYKHTPRRVPVSILFTNPDICMVGLSHDAAMKQNAIVGVAEGIDDGRSIILGAQENVLRIYVEPETGRLLGASMFLSKGEHLAHQIAWSIQAKQTVHDMLAMPFYHPSIEEMLQSALKSAAQQVQHS